MKTSKTIGRIVVLTALSAVCLYAQPTPRHPGVAWEDLPLLRTGVKIRAACSCNPTGLTYRDFNNYTMLDGGECELVLFKGLPGLLVQVWSTEMGTDYNVPTFGNLRFYFSDQKTPTYDRPRDDYFTVGDPIRVG